MPKNKSDSADLAKNRRELVAAQTRIAELEHLLATTQPLPIVPSSLDRYQQILDSLLESCQIIGFDWRYLYLNAAAVAASRLPKEELLGHTVMEMYPGIEATDMFTAMRKCMEERTTQDAEFDFTYPDQSNASFEFRIQPVPEGIFILTLNTTERKRANEDIRKLNRTLAVLSDINQTIVRTGEMPTLFEEACSIAVKQGAFQVAWIGLLDPQTKQMNLVAHAGVASEEVEILKGAINKGQDKQGLMSLALSTGERAISNDIDHDPRLSPWQQDMSRLNYHSAVALPLTIDGKVRGVFQLYAQEVDFFDEEELKLVDEMAMDISFAMTFAEQEQHRQEAQEAVKRYNQRLEILHEIDLEIIASSSIKTLLEVIVKHMRQLIPCPRVTAALFDPTTNESVIYAIDVHSPTALGEGVRTYLPSTWFEGFGANNVRVIDDLRLLSDPLPNYKRLIEEGIFSSLQVLLRDREQPIGIFGLSSDLPCFFTEEHQEIASEVGNQLTIAIRQLGLSEALGQRAAELERNNADLMRAEADLQRYAQRMEVFHDIDSGLIQGNSVESLVQSTLKHLRQIIPCQQANVIMIDHARKQGLLYVIDYNRESAFSEGSRFPLPPDAFDGYDARHVKIFDDIRLEPESNARAKRLASEGLIAGMSVFLMDRDTPIASLSLLADTPSFFTAEYQEIAIEIANQLAIAIRQVKLAEELEQRVFDRTAELNDAKRRVEAILNSNTDGVILAHLNGGIRQTNDTFNSLFSCEVDDYFGKPLTALVAEEDRELLSKTIQLVVSGQEGRTIEVHARRQNNTRFIAEIGISTVIATGKVRQSFVCSIRDITERKSLTKELEEQRTFLREVIDVSPSMIFVKDYNARFVLVNPMVAKMYNTTVEALLGKSDADFNPSAQEVADFLKADREVINTGEHLIIEEPITNANGETHWFQTIKVPIVSVDGKSKYVLGVSTDVTERRKSEEMLREAFRKEKELGDLKSRFVSMASHEFRTPLATILAVTETLAAYRNKMEDTQIDHRLKKIQDQVGHLKDVIDDVLQLAQIQAQKVVFNPVRVDLDAMCRSVLDEFQSRPNIKHELIYTCDVRLQDSYLDKRLMRQIINNLMSNAVKYSPDGKTIKISLEEKDGVLIFKIQDQGIGIPEADLKHLFEPFHRANNVGLISGTGLGLVITKESVELHGGTIAVESQVGIGTTFTVTIPIVTTDKPNPNNEPLN